MAAERDTYRVVGFRGGDPSAPHYVGEPFAQERAIPSGTWSRVSAAATADPRVSPAALRVLCALGRYSDEKGQCYPAVASIAEIVGTNPRQVRHHLKKLEQLGYLSRRRQRRTVGGGWSVNLYTLRFPPPPPLPKRQSGEAEGSAGASGSEPEMRPYGLPEAIARYMSSDDSSAADGEQKESRFGAPTCRPSALDMSSEGRRDLSSDDSRTNPSGTNPVEQQPNWGSASPRDPDGRGLAAHRTPGPPPPEPRVAQIPDKSKEKARQEAAARLHSVMAEHRAWERAYNEPELEAAYVRALDAETESPGAGVEMLQRALIESSSEGAAAGRTSKNEGVQTDGGE